VRRGATCAILCVAAVLAAPHAGAQVQKPTSQTTEYSPYEQETIDAALEKFQAKPDPAPEGKIIERIDVVRLPVLEARDPGPELLENVPILAPAARVATEEDILTRRTLNSLHHTSREWIIRRELLIAEGDRYVQVLLDETARNMRNRMPLQVSLVIIVAVRGSAPDKVRLLVIAKDIWSLRASFDLAVTPGGLENFILVPQETNLFGLHHTLSTRFQYRPETYTFGAGYAIPRFGRSWVGASTGASVTFNRRSGLPEGTAASISAGQGLYSTLTEWALSGSADWSTGISRRYVNARVATFDSQSTPERDGIPFEYRSRSVSASVGAVRSFGWAIKNNFSFSLNATSAAYDPFDLSSFAPSAAADFLRRAVPRGESRVYPALSWSTFQTNFLPTLDVNTLALQEDFRLGHDVSVTVYPVLESLGSTRTLFGVSGRAGYAVPMGDGLAGGSVSTFAESQEAQVLTDASVGASFGAVTPRFGLGRLAMNTSFSNRYRNYLNSRTFTGGDDRLRGYPSNFFFGKDTVFFNLEYRSRGIDIMKLQVGGVLFYDVGDAAQGFDMLRPKQSVGFGIRTLIPQLNRLVFRFDLAFPMNRGPFPETGIPTPVDPVGFFFAFDQAFRP
jgi:hypothetical protein